MLKIFPSLKESISSVLPIALIVLILSVTYASLEAGVLVLFLFGTILLILGMSFFTIGSGISMEPLGDGIGKALNKNKKILLPLFICFILGFLITVSEPDLQVLAEQVPTVPNAMLVYCVGIGVGLFLSITFIRNKKKIPLKNMLLIFYILIIGLSFFAPDEFVATAFDSGGVTTGPMTSTFMLPFSVNEGYSDDVMQVARKSGATGGTVIKGRLADFEQFADIKTVEIDGEREILCILAPYNTSRHIMEDVNKQFGITSKANGIIVAIPTEKAYKI